MLHPSYTIQNSPWFWITLTPLTPPDGPLCLCRRHPQIHPHPPLSSPDPTFSPTSTPSSTPSTSSKTYATMPPTNRSMLAPPILPQGRGAGNMPPWGPRDLLQGGLLPRGWHHVPLLIWSALFIFWFVSLDVARCSSLSLSLFSCLWNFILLDHLFVVDFEFAVEIYCWFWVLF